MPDVYGLRVRNALDKATLDYTTYTYLVLDSLTIPANSSGSKTYTEFEGYELHVFQYQPDHFLDHFTNVSNWCLVETDISYDLGIPTLSWTSTAINEAVSVNLIVVGG